MTRGKKLLILLGVLVVVIVAAIITLRAVNSAEDEDNSGGRSILEVDEDSVTQLQWTYNGQTMTFNKDGDNWTYADDSTFPVNNDYLDTMLSQLKNVFAYKTIEEVTDTAQYGLDEPAVTVTVNDGEQHTLCIGDLNSLGEQLYVSINDGNVYLTDSTLADNFEYTLYDVIAKETVPDMAQATSFSISGNSSLTASYSEDGGDVYSSTYTWFAQDSGSSIALDTENTENIVDDIENVTFTDCVAYNPDDQALSDYGLSEPAGSITIDYTDSDGNAGEFTLYIGNASDSTNAYYYAMTGSKDRVYTVAASIAEDVVNTNLESLLPDDVIKMDWDSVDSMDVTIDGKTYTIKRKTEKSGTDDDGEDIETSVWKLNGETVDIGSYLTKLNSLSGTRTNGLSAGNEYIKFEIHRSTDTYSDITLVFGTYDDDSYTVTLDGSTDILIDCDTANEVLDGIIDEIDPE